MEDDGSRDWTIYLTGFLIGSIERVFLGAAKSVEACVGENYFFVTLGEERKTRLKVSVHVEIIEEGE